MTVNAELTATSLVPEEERSEISSRQARTLNLRARMSNCPWIPMTPRRVVLRPVALWETELRESLGDWRSCKGMRDGAWRLWGWRWEGDQRNDAVQENPMRVEYWFTKPLQWEPAEIPPPWRFGQASFVDRPTAARRLFPVLAVQSRPFDRWGLAIRHFIVFILVPRKLRYFVPLILIPKRIGHVLIMPLLPYDEPSRKLEEREYSRK